MTTARSTDVRDIIGAYTQVAFVYDAWTWLTGVVFRELLRRNPSGRNVGIDLTEAMLARARRKAEASGVPFELSVGDARTLSFADDGFDLVVNNNMLGLLPEAVVADVRGEMLRVLRPGGRLVVVIMRRPTPRVADWIYRVGAPAAAGRFTPRTSRARGPPTSRSRPSPRSRALACRPSGRTVRGGR
jgi:ubiquinone/menaquinone biosynthesis C-methylase UbiE